jgi:hypothetical protein
MGGRAGAPWPTPCIPFAERWAPVEEARPVDLRPYPGPLTGVACPSRKAPGEGTRMESSSSWVRTQEA